VWRVDPNKGGVDALFQTPGSRSSLDTAGMDSIIVREISFDRFMAEVALPNAIQSALQTPLSENVQPFVGYMALDGAARAATFSATCWGEFPK
jgi:hypothetical protein